MKKNLFITVFLLLIFFAANLPAKDSFDKNKLNSYFSQLEKNNKFMGSIHVSKNGKIFYKKNIGYASIKNSTLNDHLTRFRIGSITKIFTATIIFQLIDEGKLTLNTKLSEFYSQILNSKKITISNLLSHRSGIHNFTSDPEYLKYMTFKKSKGEMIKIIAKLKSDFLPGEKFEYSNSNYVLLGFIIEKITKNSYHNELKTRITSKLKLSDTYYGDKIKSKSNEAFSYRFLEDKWVLQPETDMSIPHGAGAIVSTPNDLLVFISAIFNNKLVSEKSLSQMIKINEGYGKGFMRFPFNGKIAYGHNGGIDGFVSNLAYFPKEKMAISILSNGLNHSFNNILIGVLSILFNSPYKIPDFSEKEIIIDIKELKKYEGDFTSELLPLKITLKVDGKNLTAQASGQSAFPLTPFSKTEFRFGPAGIKIIFNIDNKRIIQYNSFILNQGGRKFPYKKK